MWDWDDYDFDESPTEITPEHRRTVGLHSYGPDWRWQSARDIADVGTTSRTIERGPVVWHIVDYFRPIEEALRPKLLADHGVDVARAVALHEDATTRSKIEARILAGLSLEEVAERSHLDIGLVRDYCDIFFDVQDRLGAITWIMAYAVEGGSGAESHDPLRRTLYRHAYRGGPAVCEHWLSHLDHFGEVHDLTTAQGREAERFELCVLVERLRGETSSPRILTHAFDMGHRVDPLPRTVGAIMSQRVRQVLRSGLEREIHDDSKSNAPASTKDSLVA